MAISHYAPTVYAHAAPLIIDTDVAECCLVQNLLFEK